MSSEPEDIFRYIPFHHLVEIFEEKALSLSRPRDWEDPYESIFDTEISKSMYAQCWSKEGFSDAMWRIYSPDHFSVRIRTTDDVLETQVRNGLLQICNGVHCEMKVHAVEYKSTNDVDHEVNKMLRLAQSGAVVPIREAISLLLIKRRAFKHEGEVRVVVHKAPQDMKPKGKHSSSTRHRKRLSIPVDPHTLIKSVYVDSRAPDELFRTFKHYLTTRLGFKGHVTTSPRSSTSVWLTFFPRSMRSGGFTRL